MEGLPYSTPWSRRVSSVWHEMMHETCPGRYVWNLVHSGWRTDPERGKALANLLMESPDLEDNFKRDLVYLIAVADYKLGNLIHTRKQLAELLKVRGFLLLLSAFFLLGLEKRNVKTFTRSVWSSLSTLPPLEDWRQVQKAGQVDSNGSSWHTSHFLVTRCMTL